MKNYSLDVPAPVSLSYVTRNIPEVSVRLKPRTITSLPFPQVC